MKDDCVMTPENIAKNIIHKYGSNIVNNEVQILVFFN